MNNYNFQQFAMVVSYRFISFVVIACCALFAVTGGRILADDLVPRIKPGDKIVVFGDSISTGNGYGYHAVQFLNEEHPDWKLSFVGYGFPGWTSKQAVTVIDKVLAEKPNVVTIMFGTNDQKFGFRAVGEFKEHMKALVTPLKQANVRVILLTTPYAGGTSPRSILQQERCLPYMGDSVIELGREEGVPVFDMFIAMRELTEAGCKTNKNFTLFTPDNFHPSLEGQKLMGRALADFLAGKPSPTRSPVKQSNTRPKATAGKMNRPIDVAVTEIVWPAVSTSMLLNQPGQIVSLSSNPSAWTGPADLSACGHASWDTGNLYLRVDVTDPVIFVGPKQPGWGYDSIEFFFDTRLLAQRDVGAISNYFQIMVPVTETDGPSVAACGNGSDFNPATVKTYCHRTAKGYTITAAVPWITLGFTPKPGSNIGYDYTVINRNSVKVSDKDYYGLWRGNGNDYLDAGSLGVLMLNDNDNPNVDLLKKYTVIP